MFGSVQGGPCQASTDAVFTQLDWNPGDSHQSN